MEEYNNIKDKLLSVKELVIEYKNNSDAYDEIIKYLHQHKNFVKKYELLKEARRKECLKIIIPFIVFATLMLLITLSLSFFAITPIIMTTIALMFTIHYLPSKNEFLVKNKNVYKETIELIRMYDNVFIPKLLNRNKNLLEIINEELRECLPYLDSNKNNYENKIIKSFINNNNINNLVNYYNREERINNNIDNNQKKLVK